jgi:2',3'-cyclic-nucleotide 2'-phosphodiesterase (5'-nucleotidase family)
MTSSISLSRRNRFAVATLTLKKMTRRFLLLWAAAVLAALRGLAPSASAQETRPLTILHSNDLHAHLLPDDRGRGGFARLKTAIAEEKQHCSGACLYLNAGDLVQGTPVSTLFQGVPVYRAANLLGFDAGTVGNHEFDYGWRRVQEFAEIANFPLLSANVVNESGAPLTGKAYVIKEAGGIRVAIIGVVLGDLVGNLVTPDKVQPWRVLPVVETVRKYARQLREQSDLIVVLGHIHDETEVAAILREVPEVSVVVAGHTHVAYPKMMQTGGRVAVLVDAYGVDFGRLDLQVDVPGKKLRSAEWKKIAVTDRFAPDAGMSRLVDEWESKVAKLVDVTIGESRRRMERNDPELRKMVERAMAEQAGADFGWVNPGNIRDVLPEGKILARNIWNILPFDNYLVTGKFKGRQLPPAITTRYPVEPDREYKVVTTDFTAMNQASKDQLNTSGLEFPNVGPLQRDAVIDWIKKKKVVP